MGQHTALHFFLYGALIFIACCDIQKFTLWLCSTPFLAWDAVSSEMMVGHLSIGSGGPPFFWIRQGQWGGLVKNKCSILMGF